MRSALTLTSNLMFRSKLDAMLSANGLANSQIRKLEEIDGLLNSGAPEIAIIDLAHSGIDPIAAIKSLRENESFNSPILCYGSHIKTDLMEQARIAGANKVVANSAMSSRGAQIIAALLSKSSDT